LRILSTTQQATGQANEEISESIRRVVIILEGEMRRAQIQELLGLKHRENFVLNYLTPSLESFFIEMTIPETPTHQDQRYRLTTKGLELKYLLEKQNNTK
jgi:ATP-dependent DNA helicase RecG